MSGAVQQQEKALIKPIQKLKMALSAESVREQFKNALQQNAGAFITSIIDLYASDTYLQQCEPNLVIMECLKAATLKLPINKQLGFAYIVPYKNKDQVIPQFQLGYKGYIQLALRTGKYKNLNAGIVYEGINVKKDLLTGEVIFTGEAINDKPQGYFAYMELVNGFRKTIYMTKTEIIAHAKRYSKSFNKDSSAWQTNFDEMALKTVTRKLLSKYGFLSTEMVAAFTSDKDEEAENEVKAEIEQNANKEFIDIQLDEKTEEAEKETEEGPGF